MKVVFIYATAPDSALAHKIGQHLVAAEIAACVNILGAIHSIYRWEGALEAAQEVAMIVKTTEEQVAAVVQMIKSLHPFQVPAIAGWTVDEGSPEFLQWIQSQVKTATK
jgi:periplasmic divalent cation tolerance protein